MTSFTAAALIQGRSILNRVFGSMFNGRRSIITSLGYEESVTYTQCLEKYRRQGIFSRIINSYPDAVWSRPPVIVGNEKLQVALHGEVSDDGQTVVNGLSQKVDLYHYLNRADRLAGLGKYAVVLLGFDDVKSAENLKLPVKPSRSGKERTLQWLQVYGEDECQITDYTQDPFDPNFGLPETYSIGVRTTDKKKSTIQVHHSRIIHVADCQADDEIFGYPIGHRIYNECDDLLKVSGGGAEAVWVGSYKGLQFDVDKEMNFTVQDAENLKQEIDEYIHGQRRALRTRGVDIKDIGSDQINVSPMFNVIVSQISTTTGIPQRIFIGSEQGKLASEQDRQNWANRIDERRILHAEPRVLRRFIARCQSVNALPGGDYITEWPDAYIQSPLERGQTSAQIARSATNIANAMEKARGLIQPSEARVVIFAKPTFGARFGSGNWPYETGNVSVEFPGDKKYDTNQDEPPNDGDDGNEPTSGKDPEDEDQQ